LNKNLFQTIDGYNKKNYLFVMKWRLKYYETEIKKILKAGMFCQIPVILLFQLKDIFPL